MIKIIFEDNHLIALNKPAGIPVQGDITGDETLADMAKFYLVHQYQKKGEAYLGMIHRIDRPVSGAVVFAKTSKALSRMNALMRERQIQKTYIAISTFRAETESGTLKHYLIKNKSKNFVKAYDKPKSKSRDAKEAILDYKLIGSYEGKNLYKVDLKTGRPHQIRAQFAHIGCPLLGDVKYGKYRPLMDKSIGLHGLSLSFIHPVKKEPVRITCSPPDTEWWSHFKHFIPNV